MHMHIMVLNTWLNGCWWAEQVRGLWSVRGRYLCLLYSDSELIKGHSEETLVLSLWLITKWWCKAIVWHSNNHRHKYIGTFTRTLTLSLSYLPMSSEACKYVLEVLQCIRLFYLLSLCVLMSAYCGQPLGQKHYMRYRIIWALIKESYDPILVLSKFYHDT